MFTNNLTRTCFVVLFESYLNHRHIGIIKTAKLAKKKNSMQSM